MQALELSLDHVLADFGLPRDQVVAVYVYGSRVYGVQSPLSDWDYVIVVRDGFTSPNFKPDHENGITSTAGNDAILITEIKGHKNNLLECLWLAPEYILLEASKPEFILDKLKLRASFSGVAANSYAKAGKKLADGPDFAPYIAKKSLFHSFRILLFAIQICKHGKIVDYKEANPMWDEIMNNPSVEWADYKALYQTKYNHLKSELRKLAPKPV